MNLARHEDGWWITKVPDTVTEVGPYDTKVEALDTRRRLRSFFKHEHNRSEFTCEPEVRQDDPNRVKQFLREAKGEQEDLPDVDAIPPKPEGQDFPLFE